MADHIQLDEGSSGKYTETEEQTTGIHRQVMKISGVGACALRKTRTAAQSITCSSANTDYTAATALTSTTKYVVIHCEEICIVAMGEATSSSVGVKLAPGTWTFPVVYTGVTNDDRVHAQSPVAGAVVRITQMAD